MSQYGTDSDLLLVMKQEEIDTYDSDVRTSCLESASSLCDSRLGVVCTLPLTEWSKHVTLICVQLAKKLLRTRKNYDSTSPLYEETERDFAWALSELDKIVQRGSLPADCEDSTPEAEEGGAYVVTNRKRGWR
jgi:phage gp36-like protein